MPGHQDNGLAHKKQEQAPQQSQHQYQHAKQHQAAAKNIIDHTLPVKAGKKVVGANILGNQVEGYADNLCRQYTKNIGYNYKQHSRD